MEIGGRLELESDLGCYRGIFAFIGMVYLSVSGLHHSSDFCIALLCRITIIGITQVLNALLSKFIIVGIMQVVDALLCRFTIVAYYWF